MNTICPLMSKPCAVSGGDYEGYRSQIEMHYEPCAKENCAWWVCPKTDGRCCMITVGR